MNTYNHLLQRSEETRHNRRFISPLALYSRAEQLIVIVPQTSQRLLSLIKGDGGRFNHGGKTCIDSSLAGLGRPYRCVGSTTCLLGVNSTERVHCFVNYMGV